ncbi:MAG: hypothetical protein SFZ02_08850 [bacterium]|nr:hypothetical protein [bacterium]
MRRVWIVVSSLIGLLLCLSPAMAQSRQTIYPESLRYSIEIPTNWVYDTRSNPNYFFIGESLQAADSPQVLADYFAGNPVNGQLILLDFFPLSTLEAFGWQIRDIDERELLLNAFVGVYTEQDLTFSDIAGYPAATVDLTATGYIDGGFVYQSLLLVGDVVVTMVTVSGSPQQIVEMDRLLPTFRFYPEQPACSADFSLRPPLTLESGKVKLPLQTCWLVRTEDVMNSPFNLRQLPRPSEEDTTPKPYYHTIFWDNPIEFMRRVDASYTNPEGMSERNLIGGMIQVGVYPYTWFTGDPATDATLGELFSQIGGFAEDYNISQTPVYTITGRVRQVFDDPDNVGRFMMIADGEHVYLIIIATPSALWSQYAPLADDILAQVEIGA